MPSLQSSERNAPASAGTGWGWLLGFLGVLCFAGTLPAMRLAVPYLDPWFLTAARAALAGIIGLGIVAFARRRLPSPRQWLELSVASLCLVWGFPLFTALAMQSVPAAHGGVVLGVLPLATAATATFVAGERPSWLFWLAAALGTGLVVAFSLWQGGMHGLGVGDLYLVAAVISGGVGYTYGGKLSSALPGWEVIAWQLVLSLPLALPLTLWLWPANAAQAPVQAWAALVYVALFSQLIGFFFWNAGLALGGIARVGQTQLLQPFLVGFIGVFVNGEALGMDTLAFAAAVVATVALGSRARVGRS